jgi:hypothetical protein
VNTEPAIIPSSGLTKPKNRIILRHLPGNRVVTDEMEISYLDIPGQTINELAAFVAEQLRAKFNLAPYNVQILRRIDPAKNFSDVFSIVAHLDNPKQMDEAQAMRFYCEPKPEVAIPEFIDI